MRASAPTVGLVSEPRLHPVALSVGGLDPTGTVGLLVDAATFGALDVHATAVITVVTAQNTLTFAEAHPVDAALVARQLELLMSDVRPAAIKTAMLGSAAIAQVVADAIDGFDTTLVVDPVLVNGAGQPLANDALIAAYVELLLPKATIVTPNRAEAALLIGHRVETNDQAMAAATALVAGGAAAAIVTGGSHYATQPDEPLIDALATADGVVAIERIRHGTSDVRGTGDTLSAALTAGLARGDDLMTALARAHWLVDQAITLGLAAPVGSGKPGVRFAGR